MKIVETIKSFLFGDSNADSTAQFQPEEDEYTQENSLYVPPLTDDSCHPENAFNDSTSENECQIDSATIASENDSSDDIPSDFNPKRSNLHDYYMDSHADAGILYKENYQPQKDDFKEDATPTLIPIDSSVIAEKNDSEVVSHAEIEKNSAGNERHSIFQSLVELIEELDALHNRVDDGNSKEIIKYCEERIIETIIAKGGMPIEKEDTFNVERHIPVPFHLVNEGTLISEFVRKGIEDSEGVLLKALVKI